MSASGMEWRGVESNGLRMRNGWVIGCAAFVAILIVTRPWTIRPIDAPRGSSLGTTAGLARAGASPVSRAPASTAIGGRFDADRYVADIWEAKVLPAVTANALDAAQVLADARASGGGASGSSARGSGASANNAAPTAGSAGAGPRYLLVRGSGVVTNVDTRSRVGLARIDLLPADGTPDLALQIGPVLRGTALRDAVGFLRFEDFANQIDFARVASALNATVLAQVLPALGSVEALTGKTIEFHGAASLSTTSSATTPAGAGAAGSTSAGAVSAAAVSAGASANGGAKAAGAATSDAAAGGGAAASRLTLDVVPVSLTVQGAGQ